MILICITFGKSKRRTIENYSSQSIDDVHKQLKYIHGNPKEELAEQIMAFKHVHPDSCVLELGANIGRNTMLINHILRDKTQHVAVETEQSSVEQLLQNRDANNMKFDVFEGAISDKKLIQTGWNTKEWSGDVSDIPEGHWKVKTLPFEEFKKKYNKRFDTIVADCEGCFTQIFKKPSDLENIKMIIIEHDFLSEDNLLKFNNLMKVCGFQNVDNIKKGAEHCPGKDWPDGVLSDPYFVTVWKR